MSQKTIKKTMMSEYYVCDICKQQMHPVGQPFEAGGDTEDIHTNKFDAHVKCFEKLITGASNVNETSQAVDIDKSDVNGNKEQL